MTVSISGAIDFLQDKYVLSPALQGPVISSSIIGGVRRRLLRFLSEISTAAAEHWGVCGFLFGNEAQRDSRLS